MESVLDTTVRLDRVQMFFARDDDVTYTQGCRCCQSNELGWTRKDSEGDESLRGTLYITESCLVALSRGYND